MGLRKDPAARIGPGLEHVYFETEISETRRRSKASQTTADHNDRRHLLQSTAFRS